MEKKKEASEVRKYYNNDDSGKVFLLVIVFQILISLVISLLIGQISSNYNIKTEDITSSTWYILASALINILVYGLVYFLYTSSNRIDFNAVKFNYKLKWHTFLVVILVGVIALFGSQYFVGAVDDLLAALGYPLDSASPIALVDFGSFMFAVFVLAIVPAVFEELIFRGIVFNGLCKRFKTSSAIILSALLFALFHGNLQQFIYPFILGMIMAWIVARTGSVVCSMIIHFINNFIVVLFAYLSTISNFSIDFPRTWWGYLIAFELLLLMGAILFLIDRFYFKRKDKEIIERENKTSNFLYIAFAVSGLLLLITTVLKFSI